MYLKYFKIFSNEIFHCISNLKYFIVFQIWNISLYFKFEIFWNISKYFEIFQIWNIPMYFKFGIFWNSSFENILKYFKQILQYNSKIAAEVKICINYQSCSYESTVNASKHSHFTVRLESLKEKRQALTRLSQFSKTTLNESTSRDSHLTVLHAFRPVNETQKK